MAFNTTTPKTVVIDERTFFVSDYTGQTFSTPRYGLPGRGDCLKGTFASANEVIAYIEEKFPGRDHSEKRKSYKKAVEEKYGYKPTAATPRKRLINWGGDMTYDQWLASFSGARKADDGIVTGDGSKKLTAPQTIDEAVAAIESKNAQRKARDQKSHKNGWKYMLLPGSGKLHATPDAVVGLLLQDKLGGKHIENVHITLQHPKKPEIVYEHDLYFCCEPGPGAVKNELASKVVGLVKADAEVYGDALLDCHTRKFETCLPLLDKLFPEEPAPQEENSDSDSESEEEGESQPVVSKKKSAKKPKQNKKRKVDAVEQEEMDE